MKEGEISYDADGWKHVANDAKELVQKLLQKDPAERSQITDIIAHPWLEKIKTIDKAASLNQRTAQLMQSIRCSARDMNLMQVFQSRAQLRAVIAQEQEQIKLIFQAMNKNFDESLSREEIAEGLARMNFRSPESETDRILETADAVESGIIEYSVYCSAMTEKETVLYRPTL